MIIAQTQPAGHTTLTVVMVAVIAAGATAFFGGLVRFCVERLLAWRRRCRARRAVLHEIREWATAANSIAAWGTALFVPRWDELIFQKTYFQFGGTAFWDAMLREPDLLPGKHLHRLVAFYAHADVIRAHVKTAAQEQDGLLAVHPRTSIPRLQLAFAANVFFRLIQMCGDLGSCREATKLSDLPERFSYEYPMFKPLADLMREEGLLPPEPPKSPEGVSGQGS